MNAALLAQLIREIRDDLVGLPLGTPYWFPPVLAIHVYGRGHLVAILESPGPFFYVVGDSPFEGAWAPARMTKLAGAEVTDIRLEEARVLRIDAVTDERERVSLSVALFGAAGSAVLARGSTTIETLGKGRVAQASETPAASDALKMPFQLVARGNLGGASPTYDRTPEDGERLPGTFTSARAACAALGARVLEGAHATILRRVTRPLRRRVDSLAKLAVNLEEDIARAALHAELRRETETLAAFQARVPAGASSVDLPDVYDPARTRTIELDPAEPVHVQVEKRFRRAGKLERSADHAARRLELVRREHDELAAALAVLERAASFAEALKTLEAIRARFDIDLDDGPRPAGAPKKREAEKTYRTFDVDPHWFVLVGRSNFENDELTFQVAKPTDYWFHAQGVPGSHVVLRSRGGSDGPPARVIERTASIAAHFSKAKHSSLVPVIYTQRKYVRKFRGARPGQVTCEREKMVMVPPLLPDGMESS
jgi:hypothetical protein